MTIFMSYIQQYHAEFDRIWRLIITNQSEKKLLELAHLAVKTSLIDKGLIESFFELSLFSKIEFLSEIFTAKNEKGEWVLEEGGQAQMVSTMFLDTNKIQYEDQLPEMTQYEYSLWFANSWVDVVRMGYDVCWKNVLISNKDLFRQNCILANDNKQDKIQIKNLKLINW